MLNLDIIRNEKDLTKYFYITYEIKSSESVYDAAWNISLGQSIGNPTARSNFETQELIDNHCCVIIRNNNLKKRTGLVEIGFPLANIDFNTDGISQLLCMIMGGQTDINTILKCRAIKIEISDAIISTYFNKPKYGLSGIQNKATAHNKPLFGSILKPKTGITPSILLDMVKELCDGGTDFIKEDEILSNPAICRLEDRIEIISNYIATTNVVYAFCINSDPIHIINRANFVAENGGNGVHINVWSGLGSYKSVRDLNLPLWIHYQSSGSEVMCHPNNAFGYSWELLCQLAVWSGIDSIQAGMWGGYSTDSEDELRGIMKILTDGNVVPVLSCGMTAELIQPIVDKFNTRWLANVGGAVHSHPNGTTAGAKKIRDAIDSIK